MTHRSAGFTLLEVMVAFIIAALALTLVFDSALAGLRGSGESAREIQALTLARSRLAAADLPGAIEPGLREGSDPGGFHWSRSIVPLTTSHAGGVETARPLVLYDVRVTVSWPGTFGRRRAVSLETRRAGQPPLGTGTR